MKPFRFAALAAAFALCLPTLALAQSRPSPWSGSGEFGFANSTGNSKSQNFDASLKLHYNSDIWRDTFFLDANRAKSNVEVPLVVNGTVTGATTNQFQTTANHFDAGGSIGYKFSPRAFVVGTARYDHDDFSANRKQEAVAISFGYTLFEDARSELSFEAGPGYKRYQPQFTKVVDTSVSPPVIRTVIPPVQNEAIGRGVVNYKLAINASTSLQETFLTEFGTQDKYYQNDIGLTVSMTKKLALKVAYEDRYNSDIVPGTVHLDTLFTTNLVYNFGQSK